jgi:hypothetical protein
MVTWTWNFGVVSATSEPDQILRGADKLTNAILLFPSTSLSATSIRFSPPKPTCQYTFPSPNDLEARQHKSSASGSFCESGKNSHLFSGAKAATFSFPPLVGSTHTFQEGRTFHHHPTLASFATPYQRKSYLAFDSLFFSSFPFVRLLPGWHSFIAS